MKTLLLLRHAKSSWDEPGLPDHDRPLSKRGLKNARRMGAVLRENELAPGLIISSTAKRARLTAEIVAEESGYDVEIRFTPDFYGADAEAFFEHVRQTPADVQSVMVVGHNPDLEEFLTALTGETETLPTAALAQVELPIGRWSELGSDIAGKLLKIWKPREL